MSIQRTIALLGLPRTGKSTYLGALWLLVQDPSVPQVWEVDVTGDRSHVEWLAERVAKGEQIPRTHVDSDQGLTLELGFRDLGTVRLDIPDLSGEAVRELVEERLWRKVLGETALRSDALMLFLNPDEVDFPIPAGIGPVISKEDPGEEEQDLPDFAPENACTAAKLIELLENVVELRWQAWPLPIAVVVSAWDRVATGLTPPEWLAKRLLGVSSYLGTNTDLVSHSIFGVSAQGGQLPEEQAELLAKGDVSRRVFAVDRDGDSDTLFAPLQSVLWQG